MGSNVYDDDTSFENGAYALLLARPIPVTEWM